jgi:hypothetical protein
MNTISKVAPQAFAVTQCRPPSKIGCVIEPVVTQCRPPSKIGCVASQPVVQGEAVKPTATIAQPCGGNTYSHITTYAESPDIGMVITVIVAGIFGNCR